MSTRTRITSRKGERSHHKATPIAKPEAAATVTVALAELQRLRAFEQALTSPLALGMTFNMNDAAEKRELARQLWMGDYKESLCELRRANPVMVEVLGAQITNSFDRRASDAHLEAKSRLVEGILMCMARAQSKFNMPLITAALTVLSAADRVPVDFHEAVRQFFNGALATPTWCDSLLLVAHDLRPPPSFEPLPGVAIAVFDNLSMQMNYGSYYTNGEGGVLKHMTNWFHTPVPRHVAPPAFNPHLQWLNGSFRKDLSITQFSRLFYLDNADIAANRAQRWMKFMRAVQNGTHLGTGQVIHTYMHMPMYTHGACTWSKPSSAVGT